ncbi:MAG: hypothetical protein ACRD1A_13730, partial [Terriglobales bacterium]
PVVTIDPYRRNLQDAYIDLLGRKLAEATPAMREPQAMVRASLVGLEGEIRTALPRTHDAATHAHLEASLASIGTALDPRFAPVTAAAGAGRGGRGGFSIFDAPTDPLDCWPDYRVTIGH